MKLPRVSRHGLGAFYERNEFADGVVETGGGRHPRQAIPPDETQRTPQKDQDAETVWSSGQWTLDLERYLAERMRHPSVPLPAHPKHCRQYRWESSMANGLAEPY